MTNIYHHSEERQRRTTLPGAPMPATAVLSVADRQQLEHHLQACDVSCGPLLAHVLRHKLGAPGRPPGAVPGDAVTGGCTVSYTINDGPVQTALLCHRARARGASGVIPVRSLLGATLIGMCAGQRAPLLRDDGSIASVAVLDVAHPT